ncbi:50S ribosomal protein L3 [Patescibacteria group bacterium]|nr:50S ribosomal protein L3 [Patescibacteria group bacterium]
MLNTILGTKHKMGQTFVGSVRVSVTHVKAGPCVVTQIKNEKKDGYWAVQLGFGEKRIKNITKPEQGHLRGLLKNLPTQVGKKAPRFLREVRLESKPEFKVGDKIAVADIFKKGDIVAVTGVGKGKGFAGVVKRWGFAGGPKTHGQSDRQRAPGSIGQGTTPGRVFKGKKMGGRMGGETTTVKNLVIIDVDAENNKLVVSGSIPGIPGGLLMVKKIAEGKLEKLISKEQQKAAGVKMAKQAKGSREANGKEGEQT